MNDNEIKLLQSAQLLIMDEIHRVCVKNHLRYYMIGGTAIGAVRHKGMIPWDVDIDIAMPRDDYERLIKLFNKDCNLKYSLHYFGTDVNFESAHVVIFMNDSSIVFRNRHDELGIKRRNQIYVDVLPLDQCPNDEKKRNRQKNDLLRIKKIKAHKFIKIYRESNWMNKTAKHLLHAIYKPLTLTMIYKMQHHIMQRYNKQSNCTHLCSMASHYSYEKLCMPKEYFGTPQLMEYSGRMYFAPEMIEKYLTHLFGDYMKLPPVETQEKQKQFILSAEWFDEKGIHYHVGE